MKYTLDFFVSNVTKCNKVQGLWINLQFTVVINLWEELTSLNLILNAVKSIHIELLLIKGFKKYTNVHSLADPLH